MITAEGCRSRRTRFLDRFRSETPIVLADACHLRYFANCHVEAMSLGAEFGAFLVLHPDGRTQLFHDNRLPKTVELAYVDERTPIHWYDGQTPGVGPRGLILHAALQAAGGRIHDSLADSWAEAIFNVTADFRRRKDPDEVEQLKACMRATEAGHAWARANVKAGMTEPEVYAGVCNAVYAAAGKWAVVYGDFTVSPGSAKRGGPPTPHVLKNGEPYIVDYSVILQGYRSDFTNTLVIGGRPTAEQQRLFDLCVRAMAAGERALKADVPCQQVYDSVRAAFGDMADHFPHHAGHGLGISHPEAPFIVRHSTETLFAGDVVTLEPGLYVDGVGGFRIEHNYLITDTGYERLSNHVISPV